MDRKTIVVAVILVFVFAVVIIFFRSPKEIAINGSDVIVKYGRHFINARMQSESSESFLVNNAFYDRWRMAGFFVIPMERANQLKQQYGDFLHCDSPGAQAGKDSLCTIFLLPLNSEAEQKIKGVMKYRLDLPVIKITGNKLDIINHKFGEGQYYSNNPNAEYYYLIRDIQITQENYR
jgi:hypothetical protein